MKFTKKLGVLLASIAGLFVAAVTPAHAVLNTGVATGFTALQTDALALVDLVWPVVIAITVAFIIIGLFKKAASKVG